jgi:excisionase family DNA binding protein
MIDVNAAAALASRTPETVRRWVWSGRLPAQRDGRRILVARDAVLRIAGGEMADDRGLTLAEWAAELQADDSRSAQAQTASDLVLADRAERSS